VLKQCACSPYQQSLQRRSCVLAFKLALRELGESSARFWSGYYG
jgi:hypothetical protein